MRGKFSGLQKEAIHLYRNSLRIAYKKPIENQSHFFKYIHDEFDKNKSISRKDFTTIEYLIRVGNKKLESFSRSEVKDIH
ncbi:hypothetical protein TPHA_0E01610 [Tetrapisispora phaffii CBS 4417]|uniref:Complex 1 LYR protein domain-containing protein n=1 Tax=Tetrapisispora phaffii (strain ATCC 24235 / CBS 4417 / NBRC 1672 / NRRL Y-8282 / UCD 70-5) TaxID=1071381 RepID=G8BTM6_TETPH|nr:hypothetical protein TPHA_0E01610 [Tetrapisispora phaffii CBS 4417]CCE63254.1 hypothetical protein TPHA_0E01610 [Tetrapisispora phaffii CBS 4417]